jgi:hypothetical protein
MRLNPSTGVHLAVGHFTHQAASGYLPPLPNTAGYYLRGSGLRTYFNGSRCAVHLHTCREIKRYHLKLAANDLLFILRRQRHAKLLKSNGTRCIFLRKAEEGS